MLVTMYQCNSRCFSGDLNGDPAGAIRSCKLDSTQINPAQSGSTRMTNRRSQQEVTVRGHTDRRVVPLQSSAQVLSWLTFWPRCRVPLIRLTGGGGRFGPTVARSTLVVTRLTSNNSAYLVRRDVIATSYPVVTSSSR